MTFIRWGCFPVMVFPCFSAIFPVFHLTFRACCECGVCDTVLLIVVFGYVTFRYFVGVFGDVV